MQAAGVELRERTAFTGLRTEPDGGGGRRVVGGRDDRGPDRDGARPADRRPEPARGRADRRACGSLPARRATRWCVLEPHRGVRRPADADGLRHRRGAVLAARGGRAALRLERPGRAAGRGALDQLADVRDGPGPAGRARAADPRPRHPQDLGGDDRLHARPPADPRPGPRHRTGRRSTGSPSRRPAATG